MTRQLIIELNSLNDKDKRPVYITGTFNDWNAEDTRYRMKRLATGKYAFTFGNTDKLQFPLEFKFTRGGWENKELDEWGNSTENRRLAALPTQTVSETVYHWASYGLTFEPSLLPKIMTLPNFLMPELGKKRRISVLLPHDYDANPNRHYPVLYLHDAQNLFDDHAPFGNWAIDKKMAMLATRNRHHVIIVAIDHGDADRTNEFMSVTYRSAAAEGKKYVNFLVDTLKPFIDEKYRTLTNREHTGIGGSSLGGLISIYAGLMYPNVYGRLMIFSPSLWVRQNVTFEQIKFFQPLPTKIYVYAGGKESATMIPNVERFRQALTSQGFGTNVLDFNISYDINGRHNEERWGKEFPIAIDWLFNK
jgi:predicted alpha/beta superfamily hydrolase